VQDETVDKEEDDEEAMKTCMLCMTCIFRVEALIQFLGEKGKGKRGAAGVWG
jgi:hypothetical protein